MDNAFAEALPIGSAIKNESAIMKTRTKLLGTLLVAGLAVIAAAPRTQAAGLLIADGGFGGVLELKEQDVRVTINNGVAVTKVTQVFHNTEKRQVEALYTFPVPKGASVANFSMWINGKEMVGEVLEKKRAREIYESYKQSRRDPGLLEQTDFKTFEMRIFPIGPDADQKVQITYYQELDVDHDWGTYVYPLATSSRKELTSRTSGKFALGLEVKSATPIVAMESPSHQDGFVIAKHTENYYQASLETANGSLARDIVLAYQLSRPHTGVDLITSKHDGEDGYFCLTVTAGEDLAKKEDGMDYVFVLDVSGSMAQDGKLLLSKDSLGAFINELGDKDRFEVMTFNVQPYLAFKELRAATADSKQAATGFLGTQQARGGTVLNPALNTAYKYANPDRPLNVIVLSDGLTDQEERRVLLDLIRSRPRNAHVFCIGVGNDVNKPLLEQLASDSGGLAAFLSAEDNLGRQARAFRRKLTRPVATDLKIDFAGLQVSEIEPKTMPNLYFGAPVRIYGRYKGSGQADVSVRGSVNGLEFKQGAKLDFAKEDLQNPEIDRMWAWRRIDGLLKEADRTGQRGRDTIDEVVRLGEGYSIVTEYTSFLVLENDAEFQRWKIARNNVLRTDRDRQAQQMVRAKFDSMRNKAMADLGPQAERKELAMAQPASQPQRTSPQAQPAPIPLRSGSTPQPPERPRDSGQGFNFSPGSGPVGPLGVLMLAAAARLKRKRTQA
jgi:Ca-activated chloride channel homolog